MMTIREELHTSVRCTCDVLVAGGGIAGISAALSAARAGADVVLMEREYMLGGLATAGMVNIYLPLDDGMAIRPASASRRSFCASRCRICC